MRWMPSIVLYLALLTNPSVALRWAHGNASANVPMDYWTSVGMGQVLAWTLLWLASYQAQRGWNEDSGTRFKARWRALGQRWSFGRGPERQVLRQGLLDRNPLLWLASRHQLKRRLLAGWISSSLLVWGGVCLWGGRDWLSWAVTLTVAAFLQTPLKWLMASESTHRWVEDRQSGALELLLTTPLTVGDILDGQMRAMRRLFLPPALILIGVETALLSVGAVVSKSEREAGAMAVAGMVVFLWDLQTLGWVGMWQGLTQRKPMRATLGALGRILLVPWFLWVVVLACLGPSGLGTMPVAWLLICGTVNVAWYLRARNHLKADFRLLVGERSGGG